MSKENVERKYNDEIQRNKRGLLGQRMIAVRIIRMTGG
jgi:hypothetical protein